MAKVLVTGASGVAGRETTRQLLAAGYEVRMADVGAPPKDAGFAGVEFVRCDTRSPQDVEAAVAGCDGVVHLAAWHCGHVPPVSDATIFAVNVDGTFYVLEACVKFGVKTVAYASSMAYGHGGVYSVTKVIGEDLCRTWHHRTGRPITLLRYHDFVPKPYLAFGEKLLRNGVDARDVAASNVASITRGLEGGFGVLRSVIHTNHGMPAEVVGDFKTRGLAWCEVQVPGSGALIAKYGITFPERVEQHDMSETASVLGWTPKISFVTFLKDLTEREARGEDIRSLWSPGQIIPLSQ
ncbi:NAD-dependent epimerase/dehydratase family protein [Armatimonas sp.]|uniref:NAD-dependent epimerase/dehydratase family protein n=1 Tax=Armatimonas sp. TaxID=1872638 RepID=UPI00374C9A86